MKIRKYLKSNENPLIKASMIGLYSPVCTTEFQDMLIDHIKSNYGSLYVRQGIEQDVIEDMEEGDDFNSELADEIRSICSNLYLTNQYKYEKLYESTTFEYNPIENYSMVEHGTDVVDHTSDQTFTKGSEIDTMAYGEDTNTNNRESSYGVDKTTNVTDNSYGVDTTTETKENSYGESVSTDDRTLSYGTKEHTTNYGVTKETDNYGQKQTTNAAEAVTNATEHKVAPFDSTTAYTQSSDTENLGAKSESTIERAREDTHSADAHVDKVTDTGYNDSDTNTHTANAHTDNETNVSTRDAHDDKETNVNTRDAHVDNENTTNTRSAHTDTNTQGERSDITTGTGKDSTEHDFTRSGNVGVTTTQEMIVSQRKLVMFNFCSIVAKDVISKIADRVYRNDEEDLFYGYYS